MTENRHAFMPWLLWNYDKQTWRYRELVVVDSSDPPIELRKRSDIRVLRTPVGTSLGKKRNLALDAARGAVIAWFDDDDWQHPDRLSLLLPLLREYAEKLGVSFIGPSRSFFFDLHRSLCRPFQWNDYAIFNGSAYLTTAVKGVPFSENLVRTEDTRWIRDILRARRGAALDSDCPMLFAWLTHDANVTNLRTERVCEDDASPMLRSIGRGWAGTPEALEALRQRLLLRPAARPLRASQEPQEPARAAPRSLPPRHPSPTVCTPSRPADLPAHAAVTVIAPVCFYVVGPDGDARFGVADTIAEIAKWRAADWCRSDYVGFLDEEAVRAGAFRETHLVAQIRRDGGRFDAYTFAGPVHGTLRAFFATRSPNAEAVFRQVLSPRAGSAPALLDRPMRVGFAGFAVKPALLGPYVRDWFAPVRARLCDTSDEALQALLAGARPAPAPVVCAALPSVFLAARGCSVRCLEVTHD